VPIRAERKNSRSNQARNAGERFHKKIREIEFLQICMSLVHQTAARKVRPSFKGGNFWKNRMAFWTYIEIGKYLMVVFFSIKL
jgi:hypothetical protein